MAINPQSPGVYIDEIPVLPASIAGVATAVPAFIGYVEKAERNGAGIPINTPVRITSLLEYESIFGKADGQMFNISINDDTSVNPVARTISVAKSNNSSPFRLYYNLQMYFANGGGPCYIVPIGLYSTLSGVSAADMLNGLDSISKVDEPTLLLFPDTKSLTYASIKPVYDAALAQCELLKDRFVIMDVREKNTIANTVQDDADDFRNDGVGPDNLKYGASYYPDVNTTLNFGFNSELVHVTAFTVDGMAVDPDLQDAIDFCNNLNIANVKSKQSLSFAKIASATLSASDALQAKSLVVAANNAIADATVAPLVLTQFNATQSYITASVAPKATLAATAADNFVTSQSSTNASALTNAISDLLDVLATALSNLTLALNNPLSSSFVIGSLSYLQSNNPAVYSTIIADITGYFLTINPSGAMAGIYARVDSQRGVWKAPANVGVASIIGPSINITTAEQDGLNIDATSGKSINAIRTFVGRGTLVWGARTLAGNDNEWRYINVRRLYNFMEESIQEATAFVVFEPNTANTWNRVRGMIESFLTGLWRDGALAGATAQDAFFVRVGLGTTMTAQDILEGRMIVEVGVAAVRPAEFIILKFMHKLQES